MSEASEQLAELHGPDHNAYYGTYVRDWIALCDELRDPDVRGYLILRSLVFEGKGVTNRVRVLTLAELCQLVPGPNGKPSSLSRIRDLLRHLSAVGLVTTPEGGPVTTSSAGKAQGRPLRIKIHDQPANGFRPKWPNTEEKLDSARPEAERAAREAAERDASRAAAKTAPSSSGWNSDQSEPGWNSDQPGSNSDQPGRNLDLDPGPDLAERDPYSFSSSSAPSTSDHGVADAVGQSAGGFARAGTSDGAADEIRQAEGGSAASGTDLPDQRTPTRSPRPRTVKTTPRGKAPGFDVVREAVPAAVARPGTQLYKDLHRAINDLLNGNEGAGIPRRTPEQVVARINRRWYGAGADERSAPGYRGCAHCTPSGCTSPRRTEERPEGCDRILSKSAWLASALIDHDCVDPACENGRLIGSEEPCKACRERRAQEDAAARAFAEAEARMKAGTETLAAARAGVEAWETARADEERAIRTGLAQAGVYGDRLDFQVAGHMGGWRDRHPRPSATAGPPRPTSATSEPVDDVPADVPTGQSYGPPPKAWNTARAKGWKTDQLNPAPF
ncbi:hypothetical protein [Streptomyces chartreusis]|uniref:hypothetical protein n=1 Tax=Streptomyces chartreusis TaxID=1969 RepID=UPI0038192CE0